MERHLLKLQILTNLNPQNKLKDLIVKSAAQKEIAEGQFALHLGERVKYIEILNEKDCINVKPKGWLDKQIWREINYILRLHQFAWLSNRKDSCWISFSR
jgi:homoserine dehydrogenase